MSNDTQQTHPDGRLVIAILDRGWVFVGRATESPSAVALANADCVRRWGTSSGIGELALKGPTRETKLDPAGTVTVPRSSVIALIDASEPSWPGR
jgi:hypothetical protein